MSATIQDLVNAFDIKDLKYQVLLHGNVDMKIKGRKDKYLSVTFETDAAHINGKQAIILWVDEDKFSDTLNQVLGK